MKNTLPIFIGVCVVVIITAIILYYNGYFKGFEGFSGAFDPSTRDVGWGIGPVEENYEQLPKGCPVCH